VPEEFRLTPPYDQIEALRSRTFANLPLVAGGRAIGVLGADRKQSRRPLEPATVELLQLFATQAAIAIESGRLFQGMESTNRRLFALNRVAQTVNQSLNLQETLEGALDATLEAVEAEPGIIRLCDEQQGALAIVAHRGISASYIDRMRYLRPGEGVGGKVFQSGEALLVDDIGQYPHLKDVASKGGIHSLASIPIHSREAVVGVISIFGHGQRRFTPPELDLLTAIGNQIGIALENARLYSEALEKTERLEGLIRTSAKVTGTLQAEEVLGGIAEEAARLLGVEGAGFRLLEGDRLVIEGRYGLAHQVMLNPSLQVGESLSGLVAQDGRAISVPDLREDQLYLPEHKAAAEAHGVTSYLGVPLRYRDRIIGVLNIFGKERRTFDEREVNLLQAFGDQAAIALENARLFETIAQGKREWESTFDAIADGIVLLGERGTVLRTNRAFGFWWKTPADALIGASWHDLWDQLGVSSPCPHCTAWSTKRPASAEAYVSTSNRFLALAAFLLQSEEPRPSESFTGTILVIRDITERKQAEEDLYESNRRLEEALVKLKATQQQVLQQERLRALGQMASGIAHDFNNALSPILGFTELLLDHPEYLENKEKVRRYAQMMNTAARDAAGVVRRLREFYRSREEDEIFLPVDPNFLVGQVIMLTQPRWKDQALASGITIDIETDLQPVPLVAGNETEVREVLTNLIFNAVDAMPEGGTLTLRTHSDADYAVLEVSDTGTGMTDEVLQRCLEPFFSTKPERGTGLGLAMVYGIIQRHQGTLAIESEPGQGTTFILRLPVYTKQDAEHRPQAGEVLSRRLDILVVDDEPPVREAITAYLTGDGHRVETASNGSEGLEKFRAGWFDVVVTDKGMPEMAGDQLAAAIKRVAPDAPVILLTGFGDLMIASGETPAGVDIIVGKPVALAALRQALAKVTAEKIPVAE
ncbi:MAG: GAF domain-containing protein, partial [Candidatus Methylomirabilales bacterium]